MGMYDRDYQHSNYGYGGNGGYGQQPGVHLGAPQSMVMKLIILNFAIYVVQLLFRYPGGDAVGDIFALQEDWFRQPWMVFQLLSYGFLHSVTNFWHILGNMFVLWMFGRRIEEKYGYKEFLAIYLVSIVFAGLAWNLTELLAPNPIAMDGREISPAVLGASGAVSAILLLFIFNYPHVTLHLMFLFPIPAWVLGVIIVAQDVIGSLSSGSNVAFTAHLGGFLFAYLYFKSGRRLMEFVPQGLSLPSFKRKPNLRVHRPTAGYDDSPGTEAVDANEQRLNQLLAKISASGQDSLSAREKRELTKLSKLYQRKRN